MPKECLDCVAAMMAEGKDKAEAQKTCAIAYYKKHGMTPQEAEKMKEKFAELKDIEIFEAGTYRGKEYTDADLDTMVNNFTALKDEIKPVAVIGHDDDQDLLKKSGLASAGWMESLKKVGTKLVASFKDVPTIVADLINKRAFKRISSEIYNDYNGKGIALRRVAILGGDIPEVKTLQDIAALYSDSPEGKTTWVTLSEAAPKKEDDMTAEEVKKMQDDVTKLSEQVAALVKENETLKKGPTKPVDMDVSEMAEQLTSLSEVVAKMQEADKAKDDKIAALETKNTEIVTKLSEAEQKARKDDIKRFLSDRMKEGRLSPAQWSLGLEKFMSELDDNSVTRFGEGSKTFDLTPLGFMKKFFMSIPKNTVVRFGELGKVGSDPNLTSDDGKTAAERLSEATKKIMVENKTMKFAEAFSQAQKDNPGLAAEYQEELGQPQQ
jgi:phage I-like protein